MGIETIEVPVSDDPNAAEKTREDATSTGEGTTIGRDGEKISSEPSEEVPQAE